MELSRSTPYISAMAATQGRQLAEVMEAITEVIRQQQKAGTEHEPTSTEYFAAISATLGAGTYTAAHLVEMLKILDAVTPLSAPAVVRSQFRTLSVCLLKIAKAATDDTRLLRITLAVLGSLLRGQETSEGFWGAINSLQCINALLAFIDDPRLKLRKTAQDQVAQLLIHHKQHGSKSARSYVTDFCMEIMRACTRSEYKRSLHILLFLENSMALLPDESLAALLETALRLQACEQPVMTAAIYRTTDAFFQSSYLTISTQDLQACLNMVVEGRPLTADMEAHAYRCTAIASGLTCLHKKSPNLSAAMLHPCVMVLVEGCEADFTQIHCAAATALKRIIGACISDAMIEEARISVSSPLKLLLSSLGSLLQLRYQHSWVQVMDSIRAMFDRLRGDVGADLLRELIEKVAAAFEAIELGAVEVAPDVHSALREVIGAALRAVGCAMFLDIIPLHSNDSPAYAGIDDNREWVLDVLHTNLKLIPCALGDFGTTIMSIVETCGAAVKSPSHYGLSPSQVHLIRNRIMQLWSLFPDFCQCGPTDTVFFFPRLAPTLEETMKNTDMPEILPNIIIGLTYLAKNAKERCPSTAESEDLQTLRDHSPIFLPALLMFLENLDVSDMRFPIGISGVAAWASVAPATLVSAISKKLLQLLLRSTGGDGDSNDAASGWLAVVIAIIPHLPHTMVALLYKTIRPLLAVNESVSMQKRAYSVLDALLRTHGDVLYPSESRLQILSLVSDSLLTCHVSARHMRLRCMEALMNGMSQEDLSSAVDAVLGEILICQKDANKKTRDCAVDLLQMIIEQTPTEGMLVRLCSGIVGETAVMRSSSVIGICMLFLAKRTDMRLMENAVELIPTISLLLREECAEQSKAALSFFRVCSAVLPPEILIPLLPALVGAFTGDSLGPYKAKFSNRSRAILRKLAQRLGDETVRSHVPGPDVPLLDYIQRQARRARRKREGKDTECDRIEMMLDSDSSVDSDEDDDTTSKGRARGSGERAREDFRISARPKAIRVSNVGAGKSSMAMDFSQGTEGSVHVVASTKGRGNQDEDSDEVEDFRVVVTPDGHLVVKRMEIVHGSIEGREAGKRSRTEADDGEGSTQKTVQDRRVFSDLGQKKRKVHEPGSEYRSKKSGGDVWKKGMLEPHAYIPLDPRLLSKKNHREALSQFGSVVGKPTARSVGGTGSRNVIPRALSATRSQRRAMKEKKGKGK